MYNATITSTKQMKVYWKLLLIFIQTTLSVIREENDFSIK